MQDSDPHTRQSSGSQWSAAELAVIARLAPHTTRKAELRRLFPGRTLAAIKKRLSVERARQGIHKPSGLKPASRSLTMLDRDDPGLESDYPILWARKARSSNVKFLAALAAAA